MPRRQRFKPSRKPKPAIELTDTEKDLIIPATVPAKAAETDESRDETAPRQ